MITNPSVSITLTTQFRKAGYYVCGAGRIYHSSVYRAGEWDEWLGKGKKPAGEEDNSPEGALRAGNLTIAPMNCRDEDMLDANSVDYAIQQLGKKHDKPFFIACGLSKPHLPWSVPKKYYEKFPLEGIQLPPYKEDDLDDLPPIALKMANKGGDHQAILKQGGTNTWRQAIRAYLATINFCDAMVGRLLDAYDKSPERDNTIIGIPYAEPAEVRAAGIWDDVQTHDEALQVLLNRCMSGSSSGRNIVLAHAFVAGGKVSESERRLSIGGVSEVQAGHFRGFNYAALGHLHRPQQANGTKVQYSGSLLKYSFSEEKDKKGFVVGEMDKKGTVEARFIEITPRHAVPCMEARFSEMEKPIGSRKSREDYLEITLTARGPVLDAMAARRVLAAGLRFRLRVGIA